MSDIEELLRKGSKSELVEFLRSAEISEVSELIKAARDPFATAPLLGYESTTHKDKTEMQLKKLGKKFAFFGVRSVASLTIEWPDDLPDKAKGHLWELAFVYMWGNILSGKDTPKQVEKRLLKLCELLTDPGVMTVLDTNGFMASFWDMAAQVHLALGYDSEAKTLSYRMPRPGSLEFGRSVAKVLAGSGVRPNASRKGVFVQTLEAIRKATNVPTNSEDVARKLYGRSR
jgi:hypothetical protein